MPPAHQKAPEIPPERRKSGCTGKAAYASRADAHKVTEKTTTGSKLHIYRCRHCDNWHLSRMSQKLKRRLAREAAGG